MPITLINHLKPNFFYGSEGKRHGMLIVFPDDVGDYHLAGYANNDKEDCEGVFQDNTTDWFETTQAPAMYGYVLTAEHIDEMVEKLPLLLERHALGEDSSKEIEELMQVDPMDYDDFQKLQAQQAPTPGGM